MVAKFVVFFGMVAAASAIAVPLLPVAKVAYAEAEAPAHYEFQYSVHDEQSGDIKQQQESRAGDAVHGSYSLVQPDGVHRIVDYSSDKVNGFNAIVRYEGSPKPAPAPVKLAYAAPVAKLAYAAPVAKVAYSAPVSYAAPVAKLAYAAPVAKLAYAAAPVANLAYSHAPVANLAYSHAPVANLAYSHAPVAYQENLGHVSFSSPAISYSH